MPPKKRKAITVEDQRASEIYKQKLRSYKQESQPMDVAACDEQPPSKVAKKRLRRQKCEPVIDENKKYTFKSPRPQRFSLPENLVYYLARHPKNVKCHLNVIKSCKLLFRMSKIVPVKSVYTLDHTGSGISMSDFWYSVMKPDILENPLFCKLWIHHYLRLTDESVPHFASTLSQYIHKCSPFALTICHQVLTFRELQIYAGSDHTVEKLSFIGNIVKNNDGSATEFEKVFEVLMCTNMRIKLPDEQHGIGTDTATKMAEILDSTEKSVRIELRNIPENFGIQAFFKFLKSNMVNRKHTIDLLFVDTISTEYKNQLQKVVNELIQIRNIPGRFVPIIEFTGQNDEAYKELWRMREDTYAGIEKKPIVTVTID